MSLSFSKMPKPNTDECLIRPSFIQIKSSINKWNLVSIYMYAIDEQVCLKLKSKSEEDITRYRMDAKWSTTTILSNSYPFMSQESWESSSHITDIRFNNNPAFFLVFLFLIPLSSIFMWVLYTINLFLHTELLNQTKYAWDLRCIIDSHVYVTMYVCVYIYKHIQLSTLLVWSVRWDPHS